MNQPTNIIRSLRALQPTRRCSYTEAKIIAEHQANKLRALLDLADSAELPHGTIEELPRVQVRHRHGLPVSGLTHWHNGRWLIVLNADEPETRQRFSLAHELKHVIDHPSREHTCWDEPWRSGDRKAETLADYFAGCLLMPKRHVKRLWGEHRDHHALADTFGVSPRAMDVRLSQLGLTDQRRRCMRVQPTWQHFGSHYYRRRTAKTARSEVTT